MSDVKTKICSFSNLYQATRTCKKNVAWKDSVAHFSNHALSSVYKLIQIINKEDYRISPYSVFIINEPKTRKITSTRFKDRVFQRSLCDNYLTQEISRNFIPHNFACQKGKGTDRARECLERLLKQFYKEYGVNGYTLKVDVHDYFGSTRHDIAIKAVRERVRDEWACQEVERIINSFNTDGDYTKGIGLGSQVSQLIQLAVLDDIDHYITEKLGIKLYVRYMDDFILIHHDKEYLKTCLKRIRRRLRDKLKLEISPKKTHISKITQPLHFLGFSYKLHETGKVTKKILKDNIQRERRKLKKLVTKVSKEQFEECYKSWRAFVKKSDSRGQILKMDKFKNKLVKENYTYETCSTIKTGRRS